MLHFLDKLRGIIIRIMLHPALQLLCFQVFIHVESLMDHLVVVPCAFPVEEALYLVVLPAAATDQLSTIIVVTLNRIQAVAVQSNPQYLAGQFRRNNLIAVNRENPVVGGFIDSNVLQRTKPDKRVLVNGHIAEPRSNEYRIIGRPVVDNHHLGEHFKGTQALTEISGGVPGKHRYRNVVNQ